MQFEMACVWVALRPRCRISKLRCVPSRKTVELLRMQRVYGSHCGRVLASASCAVCLFGRRLELLWMQRVCGCTVAVSSHRRVTLCVFLQHVGVAVDAVCARVHCSQDVASASCAVRSFGGRLSCCGCSVCMALRPSSRISKLRCVSLWPAFELLRMQRVYGSHCGRVLASASYAVCLFGRRLELLQMQQVYGCTVAVSSHRRVALCVFLEHVWVAADAVCARVHCSRDLASTSYAVSLSGRRFELLQMQQVYKCTVAVSSHQQVVMCVFREDVCVAAHVVYGSHCDRVVASASCAVRLSAWLNCCGRGLCTGALRPSLHQRVALCVFLDDG
eukprot:COSAG03_NODE_1130_length_4760_cov_589.277623_2_plen_332_part_00